jgi:DNA-binding MarR family transcriptional regulator
VTRRSADDNELKPAAAGASQAELHSAAAQLLALGGDLQRAASRRLRNHWRERKLSERGLAILGLVDAGLDRPSRLIDYFDVLPSTITFETDKLVAAGLLEREAAPGDRRVVRLGLTELGRSVHHETTAALDALLAPALAQLPRDELERFLASFRRIVDQLQPAAGATAEQDDGAARS